MIFFFLTVAYELSMGVLCVRPRNYDPENTGGNRKILWIRTLALASENIIAHHNDNYSKK